jgi:predicted acetyltransferase
MWDGKFCGSIGIRWANGTPELPPYVLRHIGFSVVPWMRRRCYATKALAMGLREAALRGLPFVDLVTEHEYLTSQQVIRFNGGFLIGRLQKDKTYGGGDALRFRILLGELVSSLGDPSR